MSVTAIEAETLRHMKGKEGLIVQGCGGDLDEWVKGINDELTKEGILLDGTRIEDCKRFTNGDLTCLLFPFDGRNSIRANLPCGVCVRADHTAAHGFRTMSPTVWAGLSRESRIKS